MFNIVLGFIALVGVRVILPESVNERRRRLDVPGFILGAVALIAATFATISGETYGYGTWWIGLLFAGAFIAAMFFVCVERRAEEPVLDLRYFRVGGFAGGNLVAFTGYFATFAVFFFIPLYVQLIGTASPYDVAIDFLPMAAAMIVASALSGRWVARVGPGLPMAIGCAVRRRRHPDHQRLPDRHLGDRAVRLVAGPGRRRARRRHGGGDNVGARGRAGGAVGDGRLGGQHQPGAGRGRRGGRARVDRQRPAGDQPPAPAGPDPRSPDSAASTRSSPRSPPGR